MFRYTLYILWLQCKKYLNYAGSKMSIYELIYKNFVILFNIVGYLDNNSTILWFSHHNHSFLFSVFINLFLSTLSRWNPVLWFKSPYTDTSSHLQRFQVCEQECSISLITSKYETVRAKYHMKRKILMVGRKLKHTNDLLYAMYFLV